jgi:hypothetical protein
MVGVIDNDGLGFGSRLIIDKESVIKPGVCVINKDVVINYGSESLTTGDLFS